MKTIEQSLKINGPLDAQGIEQILKRNGPLDVQGIEQILKRNGLLKQNLQLNFEILSVIYFYVYLSDHYCFLFFIFLFKFLIIFLNWFLGRTAALDVSITSPLNPVNFWKRECRPQLLPRPLSLGNTTPMTPNAQI